jgi:hypothetical protein
MSTTVDYNSTTVDYKGRMRRRVLSVGSILIPINGLSTQSQTGSTPASQVRPPATWRAAWSAGGCLRPDQHEDRQHDGYENQRRDISPQMSHVVVTPEGLDRHDCGVDDARAHGEPDQADIGLRTSRRVPEEKAQRRVQANDHHEVVGLVRSTGVPCPPRRPHRR